MRNLMGQVDGTVNIAPGTVDFDRLVWDDGAFSRCSQQCKVWATSRALEWPPVSLRINARTSEITDT